jgi:hypothetical protein
LVSRTPSRSVVDTSVDPLWSAILHSCCFLSPKCRLLRGCDFFLCSFRLLFSFLLPFSFSISFLPGANRYLCCQAIDLPLEVWELLFSSYTFWQFVQAVHCSNCIKCINTCFSLVRYVEVFEASPVDVARAKEQEEGGGASRRSGGSVARRRGNGGSVVSLRGLPYR